ncbi:MAG: hypothetical protein AB8C84_01045 [Oligoflexales bacterium]
MIHRYFILFLIFSFPLPVAFGVVFNALPSTSRILRLESVEKTTLQWVTLGHQKEIILTTTGENPNGIAVYVRLKYPDTPYWNHFLKECQRSMENLVGKNFIDIGPVKYQGQTLTRQNFNTHTVDLWRPWYENTKNILLSAQLNPSCHIQAH